MVGRARVLPPWMIPLGFGLWMVSLGAFFARTDAIPRAVLLAPLAPIAIAGFVWLWNRDPAWSFTAALCASVFAGNWPAMGVPGPLSLERPLLLLGLVLLYRRERAMKEAGEPVPSLELRAVHVAMIAAVLFVIGSAIWAETITNRAGMLRLVDRFGIFPFVMFTVAPLAFRTAYQRSILMWALVALGAYLGVTALFETVGLRFAVFPRYIVDPGYGYQSNRARGPFAESVTMGMGLWTCMVASAMAYASTREQRLRLIAAGVGLLCAAGILFTLTRSVWIGALVSSFIVLIAARELRRFFLPAAVAGVVVVGAAFIAVPGLAESVNKRSSAERSVWDRQNAARAAFAMVRARPVTGFGWETYLDHTVEFQRQASTYPLTSQFVIVHNAALSYLAEIGLAGTTLWLLAIGLAVAGALLSRAPPALRSWKIAMWALAPFWAVIATFVYPQVFPNLTLLLFAGIVARAGLVPARREDVIAVFRLG